MASVYVVSRFPTRRIAIACIPTSNVQECLFLYIIHQKCDHFQFLSIWYVNNGVSITSWFAFFNCEFEWLSYASGPFYFLFCVNCPFMSFPMFSSFVLCSPFCFCEIFCKDFLPLSTALWLVYSFFSGHAIKQIIYLYVSKFYCLWILNQI